MAWKRIVISCVLLVVIVFTVQNYEPVRIKFFVWSFRSSSAITVFVSLIIGFLTGLLMHIRKD